MILETFKNFADFELLDSGRGYRLERWGKAILQRPDPQIIWERSLPDSEWDKAWAVFKSPKGGAVPRSGALATSTGDKGRWEMSKPIPNPWVIEFNNIKLLLKLSPFKHTGLFAEQAAQWEWMIGILGGKTQKDFSLPTSRQTGTTSLSKESAIRNESGLQTKLKILNLFGYTGGATMVLAKAGCHVTHVDASKPAITWANENHRLNKLPTDSVRWMLDDAVKFAKREIKRGSKYDGIIMDPPAFGHSPTGKTWKFNQDLPSLLKDCVQLLSHDAKFFVINGYATNSSALALNNVLQDAIKLHSGSIEFGELCLKQMNSRLLSTGIFARWQQ